MADVVMQDSKAQAEDTKQHFTAFAQQEHPVSTASEDQAIVA